MAEKILGVRIDADLRVEALSKVQAFLSDGGQHMIATPNPEMLVDSYKDTYFRDILNASHLNICDGRGIQFMTRMRVPRIAGADFMQDICSLAASEGKTVYLLGSGDESVVAECKKQLETTYKKLRIVGVHPGLKITNLESKITYDEEENDSIIDDIIEKAPDILFVAFGHGKQEKWLYEQLPHLPSVKIGMGVGGTFDFISGKARRAPKCVRNMGFEWLWRFVREPWRFKRIWKATVVFLYIYLKK
jgi:N-acetylglucosaminyldiphosphoundecaprenol N-acetyl-beta-D-mannosaminyltransferase